MKKESVILRKENGEVTTSTRITLGDTKPYITKQEGCLLDFINVAKVAETSEKQINTVKRAVYGVITELGKINDGSVIRKAMTKLKNATCKEDLDNIINSLINKFQLIVDEINEKNKKDKNAPTKVGEFNLSTMRNTLNTNPDLIRSIVTKKIVSYYYLHRLLELGNNMVSSLEEAKFKGVSIENLFSIIGEDFSEVSRNNGVYDLSTIIFSDAIDTVYDQSQKHMCWENCANALPGKCPKISDPFTLTIDEFPFIYSGYQLLDKKGNIETFVVTDCANYTRELPRKINIREAKKAKENLRMLYFDAETHEEACQIQRDLINRGALKKVRANKAI